MAYSIRNVRVVFSALVVQVLSTVIICSVEIIIQTRPEYVPVENIHTLHTMFFVSHSDCSTDSFSGLIIVFTIITILVNEMFAPLSQFLVK